MTSITPELLKQRAEHNEKMLTNLEEVLIEIIINNFQISLHQQEIVKIENLDILCRHLRIVLLQNNIIEKMENLNKLKELEYLNLALNSIAVIENIEGCESLQKLDLTVNFIDVDTIEKSVECLSKCKNLKELYLTGNPCTEYNFDIYYNNSWEGCREFILAQVSTLQVLDGKEVHPSERIKAIQRLPLLKENLKYAIEERKMKLEQIQHEKQIEKQQKQLIGEGYFFRYNYSDGSKEEEKSYYTKESRREMYMELHQQKYLQQFQFLYSRLEREMKQNPEKFKPPKEPSMTHTKDGQIRQCDEGGYKPLLNEWDDPEYTTFKMNIPKQNFFQKIFCDRYLDTQLIEISLYPTYISVRVKGKLTQLRFHDEIIVEKSTIKRSQTTGELHVTMPKLMPDYTLKRIQDRKQKEQQDEMKQKKQEEELKQKQQKQQTELLLQKIDAKKVQQTLQVKTEEQGCDDDIPDLE